MSMYCEKSLFLLRGVTNKLCASIYMRVNAVQVEPQGATYIMPSNDAKMPSFRKSYLKIPQITRYNHRIWVHKSHIAHQFEGLGSRPLDLPILFLIFTLLTLGSLGTLTILTVSGISLLVVTSLIVLLALRLKLVLTS
jgi:hypothetical protein